MKSLKYEDRRWVVFNFISRFLTGFLGGKADGPLAGLKLKPFPPDETEPYKTFSEALSAQLSKKGVEFSPSAEWDCGLDYEILGGSKLMVKATAAIGPFTIRTDIREGVPLREVVDFDIDKMYSMDEDEKVLLFFKRAAEKIAERLEERYQRDLGRASNSP